MDNNNTATIEYLLYDAKGAIEEAVYDLAAIEGEYNEPPQDIEAAITGILEFIGELQTEIDRIRALNIRQYDEWDQLTDEELTECLNEGPDGFSKDTWKRIQQTAKARGWEGDNGR